MKVHFGCRFLLFLPVILSSCSEVVDLKTGEGEKLLVMYGKVTDGLTGNTLTIARSSDIGADQEPISGAEPVLIENGVPIGVYEEISPGDYRLNFNGDSARVGRDYQLSVTLANGEQYHSLVAIMPPLAAIDVPYFDASVVEVEVNQAGLEISKNLIQLFVDSEVVNPGSDFYLKWDIFESYSYLERTRFDTPPVVRPPCYITNITTGQNVFLFNGEELKVPEIKGQLLSTSEIDSRFAFDYYFSVVQTTLTKEAFEYWELINEISNAQGSIFDQPAAPVMGNWRNTNNAEERVLGYFEVARSDTSRARVRGDALEFLVSVPCPSIPPDTFEPPECLNCLLIENSTWSRPYFWF